MRNGKLPVLRFGDGSAYGGEWLNGWFHGRGIYTWPDGGR
jgi:hypothetical protein